MNTLIKSISLGTTALFASSLPLFAQEYDVTTTTSSGGGGFGILPLLIFVVIIVAFWKIFTKAGKPGWASIVPIYNLIVLLELVGRPLWWVILLLIPLVNVIFGIIVSVDLAKSFAKDIGYAIGLVLLPFIFYPMLAFGSAQYVGPAAKKLTA